MASWFISFLWFKQKIWTIVFGVIWRRNQLIKRRGKGNKKLPDLKLQSCMLCYYYKLWYAGHWRFFLHIFKVTLKSFYESVTPVLLMQIKCKELNCVGFSGVAKTKVPHWILSRKYFVLESFLHNWRRLQSKHTPQQISCFHITA